jgi:hypothetical protein
MKFIARHLNLIGVLLLASFASAAAALYFQVPERIQSARATTATTPVARYVCPMHPKITSTTPADCSECGMKLVALSGDKPIATEPHKGGCCAEKPVAVEPPPAAACPHLAAQSTQPTKATHTDSCCPNPLNP